MIYSSTELLRQFDASQEATLLRIFRDQQDSKK